MIVTDTEGSMVTAQSTTYPSNTVTRNSSHYHMLKYPPSTSIQDMQPLPEDIPDSQTVSDTGMTQTDDVVEQTEQVQSPTPKKMSPSTPDPIRRSSRLPQPPAYLHHYLTWIWNDSHDKGDNREVMFWSVFCILFFKVITPLILFYVNVYMCIVITEVYVGFFCFFFYICIELFSIYITMCYQWDEEYVHV